MLWEGAGVVRKAKGHTHTHTHFVRSSQHKPLQANRALGSSASRQAIQNNEGDIVIKARRLSAKQCTGRNVLQQVGPALAVVQSQRPAANGHRVYFIDQFYPRTWFGG